MALEHVWFGTILGADGKPIKTREGQPIKLAALLDEAEERAWAIVREKNSSLSSRRAGHRGAYRGDRRGQNTPT